MTEWWTELWALTWFRWTIVLYGLGISCFIGGIFNWLSASCVEVAFGQDGTAGFFGFGLMLVLAGTIIMILNV